MPTTERRTPPMRADERATLAGWLDFYRATLARKCEGLSDAELRTAAVPPSPVTLLGLVAHVTEVERNWFRRILLGEDAPPLYESTPHPEGHDGGFELDDGITVEAVFAAWDREVAAARETCRDRDLDGTSPLGPDEVTLRWIYVHLTAEYARHDGHADLLRERIDGRTGY